MLSVVEKQVFLIIAFGFGAALALGSFLVGRNLANVLSAIAGLAIMAIAYRFYRITRRHRIGRWVKKK